MIGKRQRCEQWRRRGQWVNGGTNVVANARERQLLGMSATTNRGRAFDDKNREPGAREDDRRGEAIGSCTDNDRVVTTHGASFLA
jgi:hypothetical protein